MPEQPAILSVENLTKRYRDTVAVRDVSFEVFPREIVGILGPNGSGKTSTIKSILGLIFFEGGRITIHGLDTRRHRKRVLRDIGTVLEGGRNIYWHLSPLENLEYFAGIRGFSLREVRRRADFLLQSLNLTEVQQKEVRQLSRGMKQKAAVACAFIHDPHLLLLDEPTLGLDVDISRTIRKWLRSVANEEGKTILVTSHDMGFIEKICDRVLILKEGRIISQGSIEELREKFSKKVFELEITGRISDPQGEGMRRIGDMRVEEDGENSRIRIVLNHPMKIYDLMDILKSENTELRNIRIQEDALEDIFLSVVRNDDPTPNS
ncbi:MAG: ABC transporter ATP-binding protein [Planctomycetota bacterium]|jgi:ABC-2 type transport system ATP-binding protein